MELNSVEELKEYLAKLGHEATKKLDEFGEFLRKQYEEAKKAEVVEHKESENSQKKILFLEQSMDELEQEKKIALEEVEKLEKRVQELERENAALKAQKVERPHIYRREDRKRQERPKSSGFRIREE